MDDILPSSGTFYISQQIQNLSFIHKQKKETNFLSTGKKIQMHRVPDYGVSGHSTLKRETL